MLALLMLLTSVSGSPKQDPSESAALKSTAETEIVEEKTLNNLLPEAYFGGRDLRISCNRNTVMR